MEPGPDEPSAARVGWRFDNSYARLPGSFFATLPPAPVPAPRLVVQNHALAAELGLDLRALTEEQAAALFSGNALPAGAQPLAQAYAGHQYGHFTMLGDGRALLLGEHLTPGGARVDIQLKGSGPTPFSRRGDGRAALGPMLREYIVSEAMHGLGVPTTRSLAVVATGQRVFREAPLPGAVLTRVAASHIRVGTFEYLAMRRDEEGLRALAAYTLRRHDPELAGGEEAALRLLRRAVERQAALLARWMLVGFVHGVMNTDNMALSGETIDYGPCAFLDSYDPATAFSSIDHHGRYAYGNQPRIGHWNLARLAEALLPLLGPEQEEAIRLATAELDRYPALFESAWLDGMRAKLGLHNREAEDGKLAQGLLGWMQQREADFTNTFRALSAAEPPREAGAEDGAFTEWRAAWLERRARQPEPVELCVARMEAHNPDRIPRNHQVERALAAATQGDLSPLHRLLAALARPYDAAPEHAEYRSPPRPEERVCETFCGT